MGECRDVVTKLEVLACRVVGVHKARDMREVLDAYEVQDEGVAYKDGEEKTHLCLRSSLPKSNGRCVHDGWESARCTRREGRCSSYLVGRHCKYK